MIGTRNPWVFHNGDVIKEMWIFLRKLLATYGRKVWFFALSREEKVRNAYSRSLLPYELSRSGKATPTALRAPRSFSVSNGLWVVLDTHSYFAGVKAELLRFWLRPATWDFCKHQLPTPTHPSEAAMSYSENAAPICEYISRSEQIRTSVFHNKFCVNIKPALRFRDKCLLLVTNV